jgi:hypothetical protein
MMTDPERIASLETRVLALDNSRAEIKAGQDAMQERIETSCLETNTMRSEIKWIREKLEEMTRRKIRSVDLIILIVGIGIAGVSAYATLQNTQLTRTLVQIESKLK